MAIAPKDYFLDFEIADGGFEIWVNDIPYFKDASGGSVATEVLVNHFVHQGKNELRIKFFPLEAAGFKLTSYFKASIIARTNDEKSSNILVSVQFVFEAKEDQQSLPMVEQAGQFDIAELLFKPALWVGLSTGLSASQLTEIMGRKFLIIYQLFKQGNIEAIMQEALPKDLYLIERYRLNAETRLPYLREQFTQFVQQWQFTEYAFKTWIFKSYAHNRLFTFELPGGESPIEFVKPTEALKVNIPVYLTLVADKPVWVL